MGQKGDAFEDWFLMGLQWVYDGFWIRRGGMNLPEFSPLFYSRASDVRKKRKFFHITNIIHEEGKNTIIL